MNFIKRLVILVMLLASVVLAGTGVVRIPEIQKYFLFVYNYLPASRLAAIHDWSGVVFLFSVIAHLVFKRRELRAVFTSGYQLPKKVSRIIYVIIGVILVAGIAAYVKINFFNTGKPVNLSAVQITEYQGEKLGSINDFRENSIAGPQHVDKNSYKLEIGGLVSPAVSYSYDDILKLPSYQKVVTVNCVEGWSVKALWEGVLVKDLLRSLAVAPKAKTIIFYAVDGYSTSFPLDYVLQNNIMMADKINGVVLPPERGFPFELVAEQKWGYKWIKWITRIELSSDTNYKGFWESRGYNNNGSLDGSKFEQQ